MKKQYEAVELELLTFEANDILTASTSGTWDTEDETPDVPNPFVIISD